LVSEGPEIRLRCRGIPYAEAQEEHGNGENNMQPNISHVVGNYAEDRLIAGVKSEHSHESVDDSEDSEKRPRGTGAGQAAHEKDRSRSQMDNVMREIDVKDAKQHWHAVDVCCYGGHKPRMPMTKKTKPKRIAAPLIIATSCLVRESLMAAAGDAGKLKSRERNEGCAV